MKRLFILFYIFCALPFTSCSPYVSYRDKDNVITDNTVEEICYIPEQVIYNNSDVTVTFKGVDRSRSDLHSMLAFEVSNSYELDVIVSTTHLDVNGLTLFEEAFNVTCPTGETVTAYVELTEDILEASEIDVIEYVTLSLKTYWTREFMSEGGPLTERRAIDKRTEDVTLFSTAYSSDKENLPELDTVLVDKDGVTALFHSIKASNDGTLRFKAYITNEFSKTVRINVYDSRENLLGTLSMPSECDGYSYFDVESSVFDNKFELQIMTEVVFGSKKFPTVLIDKTDPVTVNMN